MVQEKESETLSGIAEEQVSLPARILVVDDDPFVRKILSGYLNHDGYIVETAVNGREGLQKFQSGSFNIVMTDGAMPEMHGRQFAKEVKNLNPAIPVIMLSGFGDALSFPDGKPEGVDFVLRKPVSLADLRRTVATAVRGG